MTTAVMTVAALADSRTREKLGRGGFAVSFLQQGVTKDGFAGMTRPD